MEASAPSRAIDMWAPILPVPEVMRHARDNFPSEMLGYLRIFGKLAPVLASIHAWSDAFTQPEDDVFASLTQAGITWTLATGFDERSSCGKTFMTNEIVAALHDRHPDRIIPFAGADVLAGMPAVRDVEHWVRECGFRGLSLRPFMIGLPADDRRYYPFYAKCVELDIPVSIHTSANWTGVRVSDLGHPRHIDVVASDFPELKIVMSHGGYPWVLEAVLLAWKHPGVYLELAAHRPKYLSAPGTGWEPLFRFGQTTIAEKVLFGTGWFLLGRHPANVTAEFCELPVRSDVMQRWLYGNAAALLGIAD